MSISWVNQVFIGSCANAKYEDLVEAVRILKDHRIAPGVRLLVSPASKEIIARTVKDGTYSILLEAGALLTNPRCTACAGDGGVMADGEVTLSTANRNYEGRMGSYNAEIYLGSPAVAAATAIRGSSPTPEKSRPESSTTTLNLYRSEGDGTHLVSACSALASCMNPRSQRVYLLSRGPSAKRTWRPS